MIELLIVLGILVLLVGLLVPALSAVRTIAKETKQKAQFATIELALAGFKNDHGDYPPSDWVSPPNAGGNYCGAQKLAEALLGWDLLGFHPKTAWRADGLDAAGGSGTYDPAKSRDLNADGVLDTLNERKGPYLESATTTAYRMRDLFGIDSPAPDSLVICDAFSAKKVRLSSGKTAKAGAPILYYRANSSSKTIDYSTSAFNGLIYNVNDNRLLVQMGRLADWDRVLSNPSAGVTRHPFENVDHFYGYITNPQATTATFNWPYRPDSYILISAGADGLYGTSDDIRNFGN
jgi:type II secretory pathway pseudopilin PulG